MCAARLLSTGGLHFAPTSHATTPLGNHHMQVARATMEYKDCGSHHHGWLLLSCKLIIWSL